MVYDSDQHRARCEGHATSRKAAWPPCRRRSCSRAGETSIIARCAGLNDISSENVIRAWPRWVFIGRGPFPPPAIIKQHYFSYIKPLLHSHTTTSTKRMPASEQQEYYPRPKKPSHQSSGKGRQRDSRQSDRRRGPGSNFQGWKHQRKMGSNIREGARQPRVGRTD